MSQVISLNSNTNSNIKSKVQAKYKKKAWQKYGRGDEISADYFGVWRVD